MKKQRDEYQPKKNYASTLIPILLAVPEIIKTAFSMLSVFKSLILMVAISFTWAKVTVPTFSRLGCAAPFFTFANFARRTEAGGDFKINENDFDNF